MEIKQVEFFIDTYRKEAFTYVMEMVERLNDPKEIRSDHTRCYTVNVKNVHSESEGDIKYLSLIGTWDAYNMFLRHPIESKIDLNLPENYKYHYSLTHYAED
jgi:hypothetical protein